jgi:hypothetical protein
MFETIGCINLSTEGGKLSKALIKEPQYIDRFK